MCVEKTSATMLLLCCFITLKVWRMEVLLMCRSLIKFTSIESSIGSKTFKTQTKFSFHSHNPFYSVRQPWTKYIGTFAYFLNFPLSPNFSVAPE